VKICVYGAGAIGGHLAVRLAGAGADISCVARGAHLDAIRSKGLRLQSEGREETVRLASSDDPAELGPQDYVIMALKAPAAARVAPMLKPLIGPDTAVVTAQNGIPWWYFYKHGGDLDGRRLSSVDPQDLQWNSIGPQRAIGCVVYTAAEIVAPGEIKHTYGNRYSLGEPDGTKSRRVEALAELLTASGLKAPMRNRIRDEIWLKLWGNLSFNPVSVLTGATLAQMVDDKDVLEVIRMLMGEAGAVASRLGIDFAVSMDKRIEGARQVGEHKSSMLQDFERRRELEIEALLGVVQEMARFVDVKTPLIDAVLSLVRMAARIAGCGEPERR